MGQCPTRIGSLLVIEYAFCMCKSYTARRIKSRLALFGNWVVVVIAKLNSWVSVLNILDSVLRTMDSADEVKPTSLLFGVRSWPSLLHFLDPICNCSSSICTYISSFCILALQTHTRA